jgi:hypothetical protein
MDEDDSVPREPPGPIRDFRDELKPEFKRRYWVAQRIGWGLIALVLVLAIAGVFGTGLVSSATASSSGEGVSVEVDYQRFTRHERLEVMTVRVEAPEQSNSLQVSIPSQFIRSISIETVTPDPDSVTFTADGATYEWPVDDWTSPPLIEIAYRAEQWWTIDGAFVVTAGDAEPQRVEFTMYVSP